jgi:hypothetical protein
VLEEQKLFGEADETLEESFSNFWSCIQTHAAQNEEFNEAAKQTQEALECATREQSLRQFKPNNHPKKPVVLLNDLPCANNN